MVKFKFKYDRQVIFPNAIMIVFYEVNIRINKKNEKTAYILRYITTQLPMIEW